MDNLSLLLKHVVFNYVFLFCITPSSAFFNDLYNSVVSPYTETCDNRWVLHDLIGLENAFNSYVFGQHIATETVIIALHSHLNKQHRQKPLVLSFHGWPGGGKGFIGNFILKYFFKEGEKSKFVKKYLARNDFPLNSDVYWYQKQLQEDLEETISRCPKAVFLFDEVDKYPPKVLDGIKAYIDYSSNVNGHDFREAIFIFITNNGMQQITDISLKHFINGHEREDLELYHFEKVLKETAFNDIGGGFYKSDLIKHHLIDYVVPFLPLEREHVKLCIETEIYRRGLGGLSSELQDNFVNSIMSETVFWPPEHELFSTNGCKNIAEKVSFHIEKVKRRQRRIEF